MTQSNFGRISEERISEYYTKHSYNLLFKNFQYYSKQRGRKGEIDLIFQKGNLLVFVEVKARKNASFGKAIEQINNAKLKHLYSTYQYFLIKNPQYLKYSKRFDVATIDSQKLNIIQNAYYFDNFS
jgi:putative endonuclease